MALLASSRLGLGIGHEQANATVRVLPDHIETNYSRAIMPDALTILSSAALSGLLSATLIFLAKNWISERLKHAIKHEYDQKLETHKMQLKRESDKEIERLKAQLQIAAAERSIRLSGVFERVAETIATTYGTLLEFQKAVKDYTQLSGRSDFAHRQELERSIQSKWEEVLKFFLPHKIYFPKQTAKRIMYLVNTLQMVSGAHGMILESKGNPPVIDKHYEKFDEYSKEVSELLTLLEEDFRGILGLEERKPSGDSKSSGSEPQ